MRFSILLVSKAVMVILLAVLVACSSQRHRPKAPKNKKGCDCPRFMQKPMMNNIDNQLYDTKG